IQKLFVQVGPIIVRWSSSTNPYVKINFDVAFKVKSRQLRTNFVIKSAYGQVLGSGMMIDLHILDAFSVEALASIQSLQLALNMRFTMVEVEGDSRTVILRIMKEKEDKSYISAYIVDARFLAKSFLKPIF
ncbi:hypothetical protein Gotri_003753, partial [Gossypium trilobum]|nr:hypothetical protein [Gossypium trilobum]